MLADEVPPHGSRRRKHRLRVAVRRPEAGAVSIKRLVVDPPMNYSMKRSAYSLVPSGVVMLPVT